MQRLLQADYKNVSRPPAHPFSRTSSPITPPNCHHPSLTMNRPLANPAYDSTAGERPAGKDLFANVAYITSSSPSTSTSYGSTSSTSIPSSSTTTTKTSKPKTTRTTMATATSSIAFLPSPSPTLLPDSKGDLALFGRPSVVAGYNLTAGILIYSAFFLAFLVAIGAATIQRATFRRQYRKQMQSSSMMEAGKRSAPADDKGDRSGPGRGVGSKDPLPGRRGQGLEMSMALKATPSPLTKKRSLSERALVTDMGPAGGISQQQRTPPRNYESTRMPPKEQNAQFNGQPSIAAQPQDAARRNRDGGAGAGVGRRPLIDPRLDYLELDLEEALDSADYSNPSLTLTASTQQDAYYSGGFVDAIQDYKDYLSPAISQGYSASSSPPNDLTHAMGQSNVALAQANGEGRPKPKVAYESYTEYPIPILRSKSTRLPQQMRGGSST